ncbi:hypothetical protein BC832DRAFT_311957 [Gaertneriomyces semiglobifer]|nr:hypothetical protein BC832DRAFT_311957 [Gaertneriomyces semiglobifer]
MLLQKRQSPGKALRIERHLSRRSGWTNSYPSCLLLIVCAPGRGAPFLCLQKRQSPGKALRIERHLSRRSGWTNSYPFVVCPCGPAAQYLTCALTVIGECFDWNLELSNASFLSTSFLLRFRITRRVAHSRPRRRHGYVIQTSLHAEFCH